MASVGIEMLASALCLLGWAGVVLSCVLPMWRVTAFVGTTIVTSQTVWEGIWMSCVVQSTGQIMCKPYNSLLALGAEMQAARALMVMAAVMCSMGLVLAFIGGKCTHFLEEMGGRAKARVGLAAGAVLIAAGLMCLIPTSWVAGAVVRTFYSASIDAQRREIGASLYIGWGAAILLLLGGGLFISSACPLARGDEDDKSPSVRYLVVRSSDGSSRVVSRTSRGRPTASQPGGPPSSEGASTKSALQGAPLYYTKPPLEDGPGSEGSEGGKAPSTKSQLKSRLGSTKSEPSEAPSTKSQLKRAASGDSLLESPASQGAEDTSSNPARTYL